MKNQLAIEQVAIDSLRADGGNPRRISDTELESLTRSIQQFGLVDPVIARREDNTVIGGHQRLLAARRLGFKTVPVVFLDITLENARLLNLALNKISGSWDQELLARLLSELEQIPDVDLSLSGFAEDEIAKLLKTLDAREKRDRAEDFDFEAAWAAAKAAPGVERGDVWQLGDHRIMVGDSTQKADVEALMAGQTASLMVTDPPYGVAYETEGKNPRWRKDKRPIANDDLGKDQAAFWTDAFRHWPLDGDAYVFSPSGPLISTLCASIEAAGIAHHQWLIWVKHQLVLGRSHYHYRHEHVFYGWKGKTSWNGSRKEDSVWEEERPMASPEHPTMKPVPLCERAIENSSQLNGLVIDPFLGSGTTLIAAERTGRRCYGMEIDPHYCRLIMARWEAFSGGKVERAA
ncbi:MAG: site-specific DNA-methyltransferase [Dehalococcoidia bacterium]|nr:site-specific DNA-methyltransferase [Dehalococcoidia bacterium]